MQNPSVKYGVYGGLVGLAIVLIMSFVNSMSMASMWLPLGLVVLYVILAVIGVKAIKDMRGAINFKNAFISALTSLAIASLIATIGYVLVFVMNPELKEQIAGEIVQSTVTTMESFGAPAESIDEFLEEAKQMPAQFDAIPQLFSWLKGLIFYAIIALIVAAATKSSSLQISEAESNL